MRAARGLWARDTSTWSGDPGVQQKIANRLGWLESPALMAASIDRIETFAEGVRRDGFTDVVLLGMGGSSLAPEVLRAVLGVAARVAAAAHARLDRSGRRARGRDAARATTLYLLSSKSGTTIEPNSLAAHFRERLDERRHRQRGRIISSRSPTRERRWPTRAHAEQFRDVFINPSDIGGRYSALSFFGMVPAALMGQDVDGLVGWGLAMLPRASLARATRSTTPPSALGLLMGAAAHAGRDKLTLICRRRSRRSACGSSSCRGKHRQARHRRRADRRRDARRSAGLRRRSRCSCACERPEIPTRSGATRAIERLSASPVVDIDLPEPAALGAEFVRWEIATAVAGALLGINPFDEPNVQQAKDATQHAARRTTRPRAGCRCRRPIARPATAPR